MIRSLKLGLGLVLALAVCACDLLPTRTVPVEVKVPVLVRVLPPPELLAPARPVAPHWVPPTDPAASSCLTPEGERQLKAIVADEVMRRKALEAWAATPE
jgi:hypothetical protein